MRTLQWQVISDGCCPELVPVREGGNLLSYIRGYGALMLRGLATSCYSHFCGMLKCKLGFSSLGAGGLRFCISNTPQGVLVLQGPRPLLGAEQRWRVHFESRGNWGAKRWIGLSEVSQLGGKRPKTRIQESSLTSCLSFKMTLLSEPIAGALHWPDKMKQSGFAIFTCIIF